MIRERSEWRRKKRGGEGRSERRRSERKRKKREGEK